MLITQSEVIRKFNISKFKLEQLVQDGHLTRIRPGKRHWLYNEKELLQFFGCNENTKNLIESLQGVTNV